MKCVICKHGETAPGTNTVTVDRGGMTLVFRHVPCEKCDNCGSDYTSLETARQIEKAVNEATKRGALVEVCEFAACAA